MSFDLVVEWLRITTILKTFPVFQRFFANCALLERVRGIEPLITAWKAVVLPLHHTRLR